MELKPWTTPEGYFNTDKAITGIIIVVTLFLLLYPVGAGGEWTTVLQQNINIIYILFLLAFSYIFMQAKPTVYAGFGTKQNIIKGVVFGAIVGLVMVFSMGFKLATPLASTISTAEWISMFYVAFIIPFAEEKFFGLTLPYLLNRAINKPWISLIMASIIFGIFHLFAYGAVSALIIAAIIFRLMGTYGNETFQTNTFSLTVHYINNIVSVFKPLIG